MNSDTLPFPDQSYLGAQVLERSSHFCFRVAVVVVMVVVVVVIVVVLFCRLRIVRMVFYLFIRAPYQFSWWHRGGIFGR